jgi:hypothetical protein
MRMSSTYLKYPIIWFFFKIGYSCLCFIYSICYYYYYYYYGSTALCCALAAFSFSWSYTHRVGRTPWTKDQLVARPLPKHRTAQTQNKHMYTPKIHALLGIRTHGHSVRASEDSSWLRLLGYRDRLYWMCTSANIAEVRAATANPSVCW